MPQQVLVPILNPDFDDPYSAREDPYDPKGVDSNLMVAHGWGFNYVPRLPHEGEDVNRRPEWGEWQGMQKMFATFGTTKAVMLQYVRVDPGDILSLEARARYSSDGAGLALRCGIDPEGGTDFRAGSVQWGAWQGETAKGDDHWPNPGAGEISAPRTLICDGVEATGGFVTIFLRLENLYAGKDVSAFWMQAKLFKEGVIVDPDPPEGDGDDARAISEGFAELAEAIRELKD